MAALVVLALTAALSTAAKVAEVEDRKILALVE
jgi:hypothetical protein